MVFLAQQHLHRVILFRGAVDHYPVRRQIQAVILGGQRRRGNPPGKSGQQQGQQKDDTRDYFHDNSLFVCVTTRGNKRISVMAKPASRLPRPIRRTIREEIEYKGVSVIIPRRECIQTAKRHNAKKQ